MLGFVSMLMDISSEMVHSLLPMFVVGVLGASALTVGMVEGRAESMALIVKVFSGTLSDYLGKRKGLALFGYALGALTKPLFAVANTTGIVLTARLLDRLGKNVRGALRDTLVADLVPRLPARRSVRTAPIPQYGGRLAGSAAPFRLDASMSRRFQDGVLGGRDPGCTCRGAASVRRARAAGPDWQANQSDSPGELVPLGASYWWVVGIGAVFT